MTPNPAHAKAPVDREWDQRLSLLMREAQDGDGASYQILLREVRAFATRSIRRMRSFLPPADIEDFVQDVLVSLHSARATYDPSRPFLPWLTAIIRNRVADGGRRYTRRAKYEAPGGTESETLAPVWANIPEEAYGDVEALRSAMAALPQGQKLALELLKLKEMTLKEASRESGMSVAALKVAVHRAIKALRTMLRPEG